MRKKLLCSMLALSAVTLSLGYVNPASTVQASETEESQDNVGLHVVDCEKNMFRQTSEDTLFFKSIENPDSYTVLPKESALEILGTLYQGNNETTFLYVKNNGVAGYVDKQFVDMETVLTSAFPKLDNGIRPYTPIENANGTVTVYESGGDKLILKPDGNGKYIDQYGYPKTKEGYNIDLYTGEILIPKPIEYIEPGEFDVEAFEAYMRETNEKYGKITAY